VSAANLALYRNYVQPFVRTMTTPAMADLLQRLHPLRLQYELFANSNPFMASVEAMAKWVRAHRAPAKDKNSFAAIENTMSGHIISALDAWRDARDAFAEQLFLAVYGSPMLQAAVGIDPTDAKPFRQAGKSLVTRQLIGARTAELKARMDVGGLREGAVRGLLYAGMPRGGVDERSLAAIRGLRPLQADLPRITLAEFKAMAREQYLMLLIDPEAALAALPALLPADAAARATALAAIREVLGASGEIGKPIEDRLREVARLFDVEPAAAPRPAGRRIEKAKAS
jgi:hypothetical protein